jgi:RNA polymerase sigma-32 factor
LFDLSLNYLSLYSNKNIKYLTPDEEYTIGVDYCDTGNIQAAHTLIISAIPFVIKVAKPYSINFNILLSDLVQAGIVGLIKSLKTYDPRAGVRFINHSYRYIKNGIKDFAMSSWSLVKIESSSIKKTLFYNSFGINKFLDDGGDLSELTEEFNISEQDLNSFLVRLKQRDFMLNTPLNSESTDTFLDLLPDNADSPEDLFFKKLDNKELKDRIEKALCVLTKEERFIIEQKYLVEFNLSLPEIGTSLCYSTERVSQLEKRAIKKLRRFLLEK